MSAEAPAHRGLIDSVKDFGQALLRHWRARLAVLAAESREAGVHLTILTVFLAAAAISLLLGYIFLALTIGFFIAWLCHAIAGVWVLVILGTGLVHVGLAVVLALMFKGRLGKALYPVTRTELKKDFE